MNYDASGPAGTAPGDIPRNDGLPNFMKYALALDPLVSGLSGPQVVKQGGTRLYRHLRPSWATDLTYQYEISDNVSGWIPAIAGVHYLRTDTPLPGSVIQSDFTLLVNWPRAFFRTRVTLAP